VVLYFYPKDDTPGCTKEACAFRDAESEMKKLGVVVLGISKDDMKSHEKFGQKYNLNFPLLSDPEGKIIAAYGAWKENSIFGRTALGVNRSTFVIDREGIVRKVWRNVSVKGHSKAVLEFIEKNLVNDREEGGK
jgi:peroxiredoxin Q/BCP